MKGKQHLKKKHQYDAVYQKGKTWTNRQLVLKAIPNQMDMTRYGFSVSRRVGKAVVRNLVKRRLREIVSIQNLFPGWDIVLIARNPAGCTDYRGLRLSMETILRRAGIVADERKGDSPEFS